VVRAGTRHRRSGRYARAGRRKYTCYDRSSGVRFKWKSWRAHKHKRNRPLHVWRRICRRWRRRRWRRRHQVVRLGKRNGQRHESPRHDQLSGVLMSASCGPSCLTERPRRRNARSTHARPQPFSSASQGGPGFAGMVAGLFGGTHQRSQGNHHRFRKRQARTARSDRGRSR
jgi:hypothetical protein